MPTTDSKVDIHFEVKGGPIPVDHGFALFGAICGKIGGFHEELSAGLKPIRGKYIGRGLLDISPSSTLILRAPVSSITHYFRLSGADLKIGNAGLSVGAATAKPIVPAPVLYSHIVTTKNGHDEERFAKEVSRQMAAMGVKGRSHMGKRRTIGIHGKQVVGFSLLVSELNARESFVLQEHGVGGRRKYGCGFFEPWKVLMQRTVP